MKMQRIAPKVLMMPRRILRLNLTICRIWLSDKRRKLCQLQNFKLIKTSCSKFRKLRAYRIHSDPKFLELVSKRSKSNRIKLLSLSQKTHKFKRKISNLMILGELWISKNALLSSHSKRLRDSLALSVWILLSPVGLLYVGTLSATSAFQSALSEERNALLAAKISGEKFSNSHS